MPEPGSEDRIRELEERMAAMPGSRIFATLADEYRRAGLHEAALHILQTGLVAHPTYLSAHIALARLYQEMGRTEPAVEAYQKVLATDRENLVAAKGLAEIHESRGELVEALKRWKLYRALSGDREIDERIQALELRARAAEFSAEPPVDQVEPEASVQAVSGVSPEPADREFDTLLHAPSLNQVFAAPVETGIVAESSEDVFPIDRSGEADGAGPGGFEGVFAPPPSPEEVPAVASALPPEPELSPEDEREPAGDSGARLIDIDRTKPMLLSEYVSEPSSEAPVSSTEIPPSRTLADLYLEQGYHDDARKMYERLAVANPLDESVNRKLDRLRRGQGAPPLPLMSKEDRVRAAKTSALEAWLARVRAAAEQGRGSHV